MPPAFSPAQGNSENPYLDEQIEASPPCPRCGLKIRKDDPLEGYNPEGPHGPMHLRHAWSSATDRDGCIVALGRRVALLEKLLADHSHGTVGSVYAGTGGTVRERLEVEND